MLMSKRNVKKEGMAAPESAGEPVIRRRRPGPPEPPVERRRRGAVCGVWRILKGEIQIRAVCSNGRSAVCECGHPRGFAKDGRVISIEHVDFNCPDYHKPKRIESKPEKVALTGEQEQK